MRVMGDLEIVCNYHQCRERLNNKAFITSCSHAFCVHHGNLSFSKELICPACKTTLTKNKYDIVRADLNPSEDFRSMILAGLRPETTLDIAQRSISFWNYQVHMENMYHVKQYQQSLNKQLQIQQLYETQNHNYEVKLNHFQKKVNDLEKQLQHQTSILEELKEKYNDKVREHATILQKYMFLKRAQISDSRRELRMNEEPPETNSNISQVQIPEIHPNSFVKSSNLTIPGSSHRTVKLHFTRKSIFPDQHFLFTPISKQVDNNELMKSIRKKY